MDQEIKSLNEMITVLSKIGSFKLKKHQNLKQQNGGILEENRRLNESLNTVIIEMDREIINLNEIIKVLQNNRSLLIKKIYIRP